MELENTVFEYIVAGGDSKTRHARLSLKTGAQASNGRVKTRAQAAERSNRTFREVTSALDVDLRQERGLRKHGELP